MLPEFAHNLRENFQILQRENISAPIAPTFLYVQVNAIAVITDCTISTNARLRAFVGGGDGARLTAKAAAMMAQLAGARALPHFFVGGREKILRNVGSPAPRVRLVLSTLLQRLVACQRRARHSKVFERTWERLVKASRIEDEEVVGKKKEREGKEEENMPAAAGLKKRKKKKRLD